MFRVLFVCMGNICRSPTAEAVFRKILSNSNISDKVEVDSAGTTSYHAGESPDRRAAAAAQKAGYDMGGIVARQIRASDLDEFDLILVMDKDNFTNTVSAFRAANKPENEIEKRVKYFLSYANNFDTLEVPDPYYGGADGFRHVIELVEDASFGLLRYIEKIIPG